MKIAMVMICAALVLASCGAAGAPIRPEARSAQNN